MKKNKYLLTENPGSICIHTEQFDSICDFWKDNEDRSEPFRLSEIALDAFNTANKCGLLPSELLSQRDELLSCLKKTYGKLTAQTPECVFDEITDTINQIEQ